MKDSETKVNSQRWNKLRNCEFTSLRRRRCLVSCSASNRTLSGAQATSLRGSVNRPRTSIPLSALLMKKKHVVKECWDPLVDVIHMCICTVDLCNDYINICTYVISYYDPTRGTGSLQIFFYN